MSTDQEELQKLTEKWLSCWRTSLSEPFDIETLRSLFHNGEILVVDNFDDKVVMLHSFDQYASTWNLSGFTEWSISCVETPKVLISIDLAVVTFVFVGRGKSQRGEPRSAAQHATHVWKKISGSWCIVHEHLTSDEASKFVGPRS